jgi:chemotaxis protein CheD
MPQPDPPAGEVLSVREIYVQPGESHLVSEPAVLRTVLGSCVGITFLVPRLGIGALCHPMLPLIPAGRQDSMGAGAGRRYVDFAIRDMALQLDAHGAVRSEAVVKLFGGGDVLTVVDGSSRPTVGKLNSEAAFKILQDEGFKVCACRLGGNSGVHIQFFTATGEVLVRRLDPAAAQAGSRSRGRVHRCGPPR